MIRITFTTHRPPLWEEHGTDIDSVTVRGPFASDGFDVMVRGKRKWAERIPFDETLDYDHEPAPEVVMRCLLQVVDHLLAVIDYLESRGNTGARVGVILGDERHYGRAALTARKERIERDLEHTVA